MSAPHSRTVCRSFVSAYKVCQYVRVCAFVFRAELLISVMDSFNLAMFNIPVPITLRQCLSCKIEFLEWIIATALCTNSTDNSSWKTTLFPFHSFPMRMDEMQQKAIQTSRGHLWLRRTIYSWYYKKNSNVFVLVWYCFWKYNETAPVLRTAH